MHLRKVKVPSKSNPHFILHAHFSISCPDIERAKKIQKFLDENYSAGKISEFFLQAAEEKMAKDQDSKITRARMNIRDAITKLQREKGITKAAIARAAGVTWLAVQHVVKGQTKKPKKLFVDLIQTFAEKYGILKKGEMLDR